MRWLVACSLLVATLPAVAQDETLLVLGIPTDGNAAVATRVSESIQTSLRESGARMGPQAELARYLAEEGGVERCNMECLRTLASRLPGSSLLVVFTSQGGGWTAARVEQIGSTNIVLASFLAPDERVGEAARALAGRVLEVPGTLRVTGGPESAVIAVDGKNTERDVSTELAAGDHIVRVDDGQGTGTMGRVHILPFVEHTVDLDEWSGRRIPTPMRKPLWKRPWVWVAAVGVLGGTSFAATGGYGTLVRETTTVTVEYP